MLYEFALTPGILKQAVLDGSADVARDVVRVMEGLCENGLVGDLCDGSLRPVLGKAVNDLEPSQLRDEIRVCLEILDRRQRFVDRPYLGSCWPTEDIEWLDEAVTSHGQEEFYAIVTLGDSLSVKTRPPCTIPIGSVWKSAAWRDRANSRRVQRTAATFQNVLRPVLRHAKSIMLIDPNIRPEEGRFFRSLQALVHTAFNRPDPNTLKVFEIHARPPAFVASTYSWFEGELRSRIGSLVPAGKRLRLVLWQEMRPRLHNRFVLTNFGGVTLGVGLDESDSGPDMDDWELLSEDHRSAIWTDFRTRTTPPYVPVYECDIP